MKQVFIFFGILFFLIHLVADAQISKESVYNKLVEKYGNISSISLEFKSLEDGLEGSLKAKKGNKFKIDIGGRLIICDSKTVWNYSIEDNKCVVSSFEDNSGQISLEDIFFSFIENYQPSNLKGENSSDKGISYVLALIPKDSLESMAYADKVKIWLDQKTYTIRKMQVFDEGNPLTWEIAKLKVRVKYSDKSFNFDPPKDCTLIDLR